MKYRPDGTTIPMDKRREVNDKILYLLDQGIAESSGITKEDIFNSYTGYGGLHGLDRKDYRSYHDYSEAKKEIENGQFFTPHTLCQFIMDALAPEPDATVADLTSGASPFCNYMPVESNYYGCELDLKSHKVAQYLYPKANLWRGDIRSYNPPARFDYVVGNPPFNLNWTVDGENVLSQMYYCRKASELLVPGGIMAIIVPASFLSDEFSDGGKISEINAAFSFLGQVSLGADVFRSVGVSAYPTKLMFFQSAPDADERTPYRTGFDASIEGSPNITEVLSFVQGRLLSSAKEVRKRRKIHSMMERRDGNGDQFQYQVRKMLYHIGHNPKTADRLQKCTEYLYQFQHQEMPDGMRYEDWCKVRITEAKVLSYLRRVLCRQNRRPPEDRAALVKRNYDLVYKAYSKKARATLTEEDLSPTSICSIVTDGRDLTQYGPFASMLRRRRREFLQETAQFSEMSQDRTISDFLERFVLHDMESETNIRLNDVQKHDLGLILQKHYSLLQWEQGGGKTLAGIACGMYRMEHQGARNTWVVSKAISIKNNWIPTLESFGLPFRLVSRLSDLDSIERGSFALITLDMLVKYRKMVKRNIKLAGRKVMLVFDESDEMSNPNSKRAKAVLDCFRRVRFKLLDTGTATRNNVSELAPQLELLYNNSYNMLSMCRTVFHCSRSDDGESVVDAEVNERYGMPIPAYKAGYSLFSASHLPEKITVFGVGKRTQDIYNAEELDRICGYACITRTLEEIMGKDLCRLHQVTVPFSSEERELYEIAMNEFYKLRGNYFSSTGNSRKDSMLALIQQITTLLRISAAPDTFTEYRGNGTPTKLEKVMDMIAGWPDEIVVVGVRHKSVLDSYRKEIVSRFPGRHLFVVTGSTTTLAQRRALRGRLRDSRNGILLCTQQSLPSSVNFEFVDKAIIPELHYNNAQMSQFYRRFVRYTSSGWKDIYFVTYAGSIEANQMRMVLAKEKLNLFIKGQDIDLDEVYRRFGVEKDLFGALLSRERDENGSFQIRWGEQKIG